jgi:hypothetical protein
MDQEVVRSNNVICSECISKNVDELVQTVVTSELEKIGALEWSTTEGLEPLNL